VRIRLLGSLLVPCFCALAAAQTPATQPSEPTLAAPAPTPAAVPAVRAGDEEDAPAPRADANASGAAESANASIAEDDAGSDPAAEDPNASRLAGVAPAAHDAAAGPIEPLDLVEEFVRFSTAAGEDQELDKAAFGANRQQHNPFARSFDRWKTLLLFDRNHDGKISWPEAVRYRRELRRQLLALYDADRDGQLAGEERAAANKALAEGRIPALTPPKDENRAEPDGDDSPASQPRDPAPVTHPAERE
jgi:hypothetical protein